MCVEESDTAPPAALPPPPSAAAKAAAAKIRHSEELLQTAAIDTSLQKPVDHKKLAGSKVLTDTLPSLTHH
jgi:hypothetical protein